MSISHEFDYRKPGSLEEAHELVRESGEGAALLAGGTDLVAWLRDGLVTPGLVVDLKGIPGLADISDVDGVLSLGALVTFADVIHSLVIGATLPVMVEMARVMGSTGIRNRATIAGNICSGVPSCDSGPVLLACDAAVHVSAPAGDRTVPVTEWFKGPKTTALWAGEIVTRISMPVPKGQHGGCYVKLRRNRGEDLAQAGVAVMALPDRSYRVAFGAVAPTPVRARRIESLLTGREIDEASVEEAKRLVPDETAPIGDIRASREYREHMLPVMLERALRAAASRRDGGGPPYGTSLI
jgi:CO/xanthine dehydrogenase FAD-binding subunit